MKSEVKELKVNVMTNFSYKTCNSFEEFCAGMITIIDHFTQDCTNAEHLSILFEALKLRYNYDEEINEISELSETIVSSCLATYGVNKDAIKSESSKLN